MINTAKKFKTLPQVRGEYRENAPMGAVGWFRCGGSAEVLFKPADKEDLQQFLMNCPPSLPSPHGGEGKDGGATDNGGEGDISIFGVLSNTIVRDGGIKGVTIRLGKEFAGIEILPGYRIKAGALALDASVAKAAADAGISGLEFFSGIPGTIGGALRMNAGCYGSETKDVLVDAEAVDRNGKLHMLFPKQMGMTYRHTETPADYIFSAAIFQGAPGDPEKITVHMKEIKEKRDATQPIREKTGGSTFANPSAEEIEKAGLPAGTKVWQLIDKAGGRGLRIGGAVMSEKHCNFMINAGTATAADLENLGEEVRRRVYEDCGIALRWEIKRVGEK